MLHLHVGQCGNQLAGALWPGTTPRPAGLVLVDSEPKVVGALRGKVGAPPDCVVSDRAGRGNNWAMGYHDASSLQERALDVVRREAERLDYFEGTTVYHSVAGGTGSGLGSKLVEQLRDTYPLQTLQTVSVLPFPSGETPVQQYNTLFTLATLQEHADMVCVFRNSDLLAALSKRGESRHQISVHEINKHIARALAGMLLPRYETRDYLTTCCPDPKTKFVRCWAIGRNSSTATWPDLVRDTVDRAIPPGTRSLGAVIRIRGDRDGSFRKRYYDDARARIAKRLRPVAWNPHALDVVVTRDSGPASISVVANTADMVDTLEAVASRAQIMLEAGAYVHWYRRYGLTDDDFVDAVHTLLSARDAYEEVFRE